MWDKCLNKSVLSFFYSPDLGDMKRVFEYWNFLRKYLWISKDQRMGDFIPNCNCCPVIDSNFISCSQLLFFWMLDSITVTLSRKDWLIPLFIIISHSFCGHTYAGLDYYYHRLITRSGIMDQPHTLRKNSSPHCISSSQSPFCRYSMEWAD